MGHFSGRSDWCVSIWALRSLKTLPQSRFGHLPFWLPSSSNSATPDMGLSCGCLKEGWVWEKDWLAPCWLSRWALKQKAVASTSAREQKKTRKTHKMTREAAQSCRCSAQRKDSGIVRLADGWAWVLLTWGLVG